MAVDVDMKALLEAGAHFGHKTSRWHPKMAPYIHSKRQSAHIINLEKTVEGLEKALPKATEIVKNGKKILFVGNRGGVDTTFQRFVPYAAHILVLLVYREIWTQTLIRYPIFLLFKWQAEPVL